MLIEHPATRQYPRRWRVGPQLGDSVCLAATECRVLNITVRINGLIVASNCVSDLPVGHVKAAEAVSLRYEVTLKHIRSD